MRRAHFKTRATGAARGADREHAGIPRVAAARVATTANDVSRRGHDVVGPSWVRPVAGPTRQTDPAGLQEGRAIPRRFMRLRAVLGVTFKRRAAPRAPSITQSVRSSA